MKSILLNKFYKRKVLLASEPFGNYKFNSMDLSGCWRGEGGGWGCSFDLEDFLKFPLMIIDDLIEVHGLFLNFGISKKIQ